MIGNRNDMLARLKSVLPRRWFPDETPVLDAVLGGLAEIWTCLYAQLEVARAQTRIATASGPFLDMISADFIAPALARRTGEVDEIFRRRIQRELVRPRGTRAAIAAALTDLTGRVPDVFEPARPADTGGWGAGSGYGSVGGWGSISLPMQCFVTARRPVGQGIGVVAGWGAPTFGWGMGAGEYAALSDITGQVTDAEIADAVRRVLPTASIAWLRITS